MVTVTSLGLARSSAARYTRPRGDRQGAWPEPRTSVSGTSHCLLTGAAPCRWGQFDILSHPVRIRTAHSPFSHPSRDCRMNWLTAIPVYNEERHLAEVLREVRRYSEHILVV